MTDPVRQLADEIEPKLQAAFLQAIEAIRANVDVPSLLAAAERNDEEAVVAYVGDHMKPVREILQRGFTQAGGIAAQRLGLTFEPAEPSAIADRASALKGIMASLIADTARGMLQAAFRATLLPAAVAGSLALAALPAQAGPVEKAIIVRDAIGLTPAQGASLTVFRAVLETAAAQQAQPPARVGFTRPTPPTPELPPHFLRHLSAPQRATIEKAAAGTLDREKIEALVSRQRRVLLEVRARATATTGATTITNAGEHAAWRQAVENRDLGPEWRRFWQDAGDEKVRHAHRQVSALNPTGVGIDEPFDTPLGPCLAPPLEINCRCRVELRRAA